MMKSAILATLLASAAAFAPSQDAAVKTTALSATDYSNEVGVQAPLGLWDPLGMIYNADQETFDRLRYCEIKHGRVAMLAVVGWLVTDAGIRFPGAESVPSSLAVFNEGAVPDLVWAQLFATIGLMEMVNQDAGLAKDGVAMGEFPGDFRNGVLDFGWDKQSDAWKRNKRSIELNNGRAAQMGIFGIVVHENIGNINEILPGH